jgi:RND family efflux transporter MFP subunit
MFRRSSGRLAGLAALLALGALVFVGNAPSPAAPAAVDVSKPLRRNLPDFEDFTGRVAPVASVEVRALVSGMLQKVHFKAGAQVKKGDLLFEIDPTVYKLFLDKAVAEMAFAEARRKRTEVDYQRVLALRTRGAASKEEVDNVAAARAEAEATLRSARAKVDLARVELARAKIEAPLGGKVGVPLVAPGNVVIGGGEAPTVLAKVVSTDPVYVSFEMGERSLLRYQRLFHAKKLRGPVPAFMGLADEEGFPRKGTFEGFDNRVNPATGTIRARATFPNADGLMLPGLFARVRLSFGGPRPVLLVPEGAVGAEGGKKFLLVVNAKDVVERREVKLGQRADGLRVVEEGLGPDDWVAVKGLGGLRPGDAVAPRRVELSPPAKK